MADPTDPTERFANALRAEADSRRAQLAADVALMRDLGVTRWGDIEIGPAPAEASEDAPQHEDSAAAKAEEVPIRIVPRHVARLIPRVLSDE